MGVLIRLLLGGIVALISMFSYCSSSSDNPVTGEKQRVGISYEEEVMLGTSAAPKMVQQHGGLDPDESARALVQTVGQSLIASVSGKMPYSYEFHLLDDAQTINAFALPGGQVFITEGLLRRLKTEGQLAGVLAHEVSHVIARHGAEHVAKAQLAQGLTGAALLATYDPSNPSSQQRAQMTVLVGQLISMKFGRADELEADSLGVGLAAEAGYDPRALLEVMDILGEASASGRQPEFFSTHPNPKNRKQRIESAISKLYPKGLPEGLKP